MQNAAHMQVSGKGPGCVLRAAYSSSIASCHQASSGAATTCTATALITHALIHARHRCGCPLRLQIQSIVRLVVRRSARMAAILLVAVLRLQGWQEAPRRLVVAVDGGVFLKYHNWRVFLDTYLREAFGEPTAATACRKPRCSAAAILVTCLRFITVFSAANMVHKLRRRGWLVVGVAAKAAGNSSYRAVLLNACM